MNFYLFDSWSSLLRVVISGVGAYVCLIFFLRIAGKRSLAKMNAFDLVVTVSLGSTLATITLSQDVTLSQGVLALALLIGLQVVLETDGSFSVVTRGEETQSSSLGQIKTPKPRI